MRAMSRWGRALAAALLALTMTTMARAEVAPAAYWRFNETSGSNVQDSTGLHNGTLYASAGGWRGNGICDRSVELLYRYDRIEVGESLDNTFGGSFSVATWIYWKGPHSGDRPKVSYILDMRNDQSASTAGLDAGFIVYVVDGTVVFDVHNPWRRVTSTVPIPVNAWTHVAAVFDNGTMRLYLNGVPAGEQSVAAGYTKSIGHAAIGNNRWAPGDDQDTPLNGSLDDLRVYDYALSLADVEAIFTRCLYHLDLVVLGGGSVTISPDQVWFAAGAQVTLKESAGGSEVFIDWRGDASGGATSTTITMNGHKRVVAAFTGCGLDLGTLGSGAGNLTVDYPPDYPGAVTRFVPGDIAGITATADPASEFGGWEGDAGGVGNPVDVVMDGDKSVDAIFCGDGEHGLSTATVGPGQITRTPDGYCFTANSVVNLVGQAESGWEFRSWSGDVTTAVGNQATVQMSAPRAVSAAFGGYVLTTSADGRGTVERNPDRPEYASGESVELTASPDTEEEFSFWSGGAAGTSNPVTVVMNADLNATAHFTPKSPVGSPVGDAPGRLTLRPAMPNPSRGTATINFELPRPAKVSLLVEDVAGRIVRVAQRDMALPAGRHEWKWDGRDDRGVGLRPGVYFAVLIADGAKQTARLVALR
jgi:hypothetical protein